MSVNKSKAGKMTEIQRQLYLIDVIADDYDHTYENFNTSKFDFMTKYDKDEIDENILKQKKVFKNNMLNFEKTYITMIDILGDSREIIFKYIHKKTKNIEESVWFWYGFMEYYENRQSFKKYMKDRYDDFLSDIPICYRTCDIPIFKSFSKLATLNIYKELEEENNKMFEEFRHNIL